MDELRAEVEAAERKVEAFRGTTPIISDDDGTLLAEQIYAMNRAQIDAQLELDTANPRLARLDAAVSARGSTAAFAGVESPVIDQPRPAEMRLRPVVSELLRPTGARHPRGLPLRSAPDQRPQH